MDSCDSFPLKWRVAHYILQEDPLKRKITHLNINKQSMYTSRGRKLHLQLPARIQMDCDSFPLKWQVTQYFTTWILEYLAVIMKESL